MSGRIGVPRKVFLEYAKYDESLLAIEKEIKQHARKHKNAENYCANMYWYGYVEDGCWHPGYKKRVCKLVGWNAGVEALKTTRAYDDVYCYLYWLLPDCNHDPIFGFCV